MKIRSLYILVALTLALPIIGCGLTNKMDEMQATTDELKIRTALLARQQRQGVAASSRANALKMIIDENTSFGIKLDQSANYFWAFEFQLWSNILDDDANARQDLFKIGIQEFMITLNGIIDGNRPSPNPLSSDPKMLSLLALGATAEQINMLQTDASIRSPFTPESMLSLITEGLRWINRQKQGPVVMPKYAQALAPDEDQAVYFLQLRYNAFSTIVMDKLVQMSQKSLFEKLWILLFGDVEVDLATLNYYEINEINNQYINGAISVRKDLRELGHPTTLNGNLYKILHKTTFKDDPQATPEKAALVVAFKANYSRLLCEADNCQ